MNTDPRPTPARERGVEILGIDDAEIGEFAYDYVELTREVLNDVDGETGSLFSGDARSFNPDSRRRITPRPWTRACTASRSAMPNNKVGPSGGVAGYFIYISFI